MLQCLQTPDHRFDARANLAVDFSKPSNIIVNHGKGFMGVRQHGHLSQQNADMRFGFVPAKYFYDEALPVWVKETEFHAPTTTPLTAPATPSGALAFDSFFTHILCHELMHGLGPHNIKVGGQDTTPRKQLKELYSAIEEAKADMTGLWALQFMIDRGIIEKSMERTLYTTYLASMFRSVRFGITEAHGRGVAMQFNYLTDEGAIKFNEANGTFSIDHAKIKDSVRKLTSELLTMEAEGSYDKAKAILDKFAVIRPPMQQALDKLKDVPVDIEPVFPLAK